MATLWCGACGSVGEPRPPLVNVPEQPLQFQARQVEDRVELSWVWPLRTTGGELLRREIDGFEVYALDVAAEAPPSEALEQQGVSLLRLDSDDLEASPGETVRASVSIAEHYGKRTAIAVRGRTTRGKASPWSTMTVLEVVRPPSAPGKLSAKTVPDGVQLEWGSVEGANSYVIERRIDDQSAFESMNRTGENQFLDRSVVWGAEHEYRVRAEADSSSGDVPGPASRSVRVDAEDTFPPAPPQGLRAVVTDSTVELTWSPSEAYDLAGYLVLRDGRPVHDALLRSPSFSDPGSLGSPRTYVVVAEDREGNRSQPSETVQVSPR